MIQYDFAPGNLPPGLHSALGHLVAASAQTESALNYVISALLGVSDNVGMTVTTNMTMPQRLSALRTAADLKLPQGSNQLQQLLALVTRADNAFSQRNKYVHRSWCRDQSGRLHLIKQIARKRLEVQAEPATVEEVESAYSEMLQVGLLLASFPAAHGLSVWD